MQRDFHKEYKDADEEMERRRIWESRVAAIERHNAEYVQGKTTFTMAENMFADKVPRM